MKIRIIGAGPTGLGAARRLSEIAPDDYVVYEKTGQVGGLAKSWNDKCGFIWDFAVHVFYSHYRYVDELMESILVNGFCHLERRSWVRVFDGWVPYPFQYNIRHLPKIQREECLRGLEVISKTSADCATFEEWILASVGTGIAKYFMFPYNRKLWCVEPSVMGTQWLGQRVPFFDLKRVRKNIKNKHDDVNWGPNQTFIFPRSGGTGAIWRAIASQLPANHLHCNAEVKSIDTNKQRIRLSDGTESDYDAVISTIPIPELIRVAKLDSLRGLTKRLLHTHVYMIGLAYPCALPEELEGKTWVYCPEDKSLFYRVTPFSTFSETHVPDIRTWCSFMCEVAEPGTNVLRDPAELVAGAIDGMENLGLMARREDIHVFTKVAPYGYPVPTIDRDEVLSEVMTELEKVNIYSRGRFGGWKYEVGNMDHSFMQGVEVVDRIRTGTKETTWPTPELVNK
jgi:protoporphyrinogen oxidase